MVKTQPVQALDMSHVIRALKFFSFNATRVQIADYIGATRQYVDRRSYLLDNHPDIEVLQGYPKKYRWIGKNTNAPN